MNERLSIFIASPDSYSDVFSIFLKSFEKFWPDCPYEIVLATNTNSYDKIHVIHNNKQEDTWTERALPALQQIKTKYVLLMCDDLFINKQADVNWIEDILDDMDMFNLCFCKYSKYAEGKLFGGKSGLLKVHKQRAYGKDLQLGIYNREYLINCLGDGTMSAWDIENQWIMDTLTAPDEYFDEVVFCKKPILNTLHGVAKGRFFPSVVKKLRNNKISLETNRKSMSVYEEVWMKIRFKIGIRMSPKFRRRIKNILRKIGISFVTKN